MIGCGRGTDRSSPPRPRAPAKKLWLLCLATSFPVLAGFAPPSTGIEGLGVKVPDAELAEMRGKFINSRGVSFFGLQLQTSWQGTDGVTTYATVLFSVDFASLAGQAQGAAPRLLVGWSRACDGCGDSAMDVTTFGPAAADDYVAIDTSAGGLPVGGLSTVQGAVQSQNISGSDNRVRNDMQIAVVPASALPTLKATEGLTEVTSSASETFSDGDAVHVLLGSNSLMLAMSSGQGPDAVRQGVDGVFSQAAQHVLLASDFNSIHNSIGITIGLNELMQADALRAQAALSAMKGRGF